MTSIAEATRVERLASSVARTFSVLRYANVFSRLNTGYPAHGIGMASREELSGLAK